MLFVFGFPVASKVPAANDARERMKTPVVMMT